MSIQAILNRKWIFWDKDVKRHRGHLVANGCIRILEFVGTCILKFNVYLFDGVVRINYAWVWGSLYMDR